MHFFLFAAFPPVVHFMTGVVPAGSVAGDGQSLGVPIPRSAGRGAVRLTFPAPVIY